MSAARDLAAAVAELADAMVNIGPGPFNHATCSEAEAVANVLLVGGYPKEAARVLWDHGDGDDDCDDLHHDIYVASRGEGEIVDERWVRKPGTCDSCGMVALEDGDEVRIITPAREGELAP